MNIVIYSTDTCRYCVEAKKYLNNRGLSWTEQAPHTEGWPTGMKTVPQIVIDGKHIGGYEDLRKFFVDVGV